MKKIITKNVRTTPAEDLKICTNPVIVAYKNGVPTGFIRKDSFGCGENSVILQFPNGNVCSGTFNSIEELVNFHKSEFEFFLMEAL